MQADGMETVASGPSYALTDALHSVLSELRDKPQEDIKKPSNPCAGNETAVLGAEKVVLYSRAPHIRKALWTELGNRVAECEKRPCPSTDNVYVPGDRWMSLRLDGSGFSKLTQLLRSKGVLSRGYSAEFADIMVSCARELLLTVNGYCAYTQSDEMTVLIPPRRFDKSGCPYPHDYNGRVQKLASQSAAFVASRFNWHLMHIFVRHGLSDMFKVNDTSLELEGSVRPAEDSCLMPISCIATFDCRVGSYESFEEAVSLILWRSYDCGVNGVQDKVHQLKGDAQALPTAALRESRSEVSGKDVGTKLKWLAEHDFLPLPDHQAYGTFMAVARRSKVCTNQKTGVQETKLVRNIEVVPGNVVINYLQDKLFPEDDQLDHEPAEPLAQDE